MQISKCLLTTSTNHLIDHFDMDLYLAYKIGSNILRSVDQNPSPAPADTIDDAAEKQVSFATVRIYRPAEITKMEPVSPKTYDLLCLAEDAIRYTHCALPKGSANQVEHLRSNINNRGLPESTYAQVLTTIITAELTELFPPQGLLRYGLVSGVAQYYGGGNCGIRATVAMNYLIAHAPAGTKISYCFVAPNKMSVIRPGHEFLVLESPAAQAVVCDAFPANHPQAALCKHYFLPFQQFSVGSDIKIVEQGRNLMVEYFTSLEEHYAG